MVMSLRICVLLVLFLLGAGAPALANCQDEIPLLKARLAAADRKAANIGRAKHELGKAEERAKDETACANALARAWRAYRTKPPQAAPAAAAK